MSKEKRKKSKGSLPNSTIVIGKVWVASITLFFATCEQEVALGLDNENSFQKFIGLDLDKH